MKTLCKSLFALTAAALVSTTAARANVTFHVSGSTAFRAAAINAITRILAPTQAVYIGSSLAGANDCAFQGTLAGVTGPVTVECHFGGSITGIVGLTQPASNHYHFQTFDTTTGGAANTSAARAATAGGQSNFFSPYGLLPSAGGGYKLAASGAVANPDNAATDVGFSDAFQGTATLVTSAAASSPALVDTQVGVLPFAWMKSSAKTTDTDYAAWQRFTDITSNNAATLFGSGGLSFQILDGNSADVAVNAIAVGRDEDSGTRVAGFAESGFGVGNSPSQYEITTSGGAAAGPDAVVASLVLQSDVAFPTIGGGYGSGGNIADAFATTGWDAAGGYGVAYIGAADTDGAITEGYQITAGVTGGGTTYTAAGLTGSKVAESIAAGNNVYIENSTPGANNGFTFLGTVSSVNNITKLVTLSTAIPAGTHAIIVDVLTGTNYVRSAFLTYNGALLSQANILNGKNSFWEYEHYFTPAAGLTGDKLTVSNALSSDLISTDAQVAGYLIGALVTGNGTLTKSQEGATINLQ